MTCHSSGVVSARAQKRRKQIIDAALSCFAQKGYHSTGIADIAAILGIGHGTFYRYFQNKRDIFSSVLDEVIGRVSSMLMGENPHASTTADEYREQVVRIARALNEIFQQDEAYAQIVFYEAVAVDAEMRARVHRAFDLMAQITVSFMGNGVKRGFLRSDLDLPTTARAVNAMSFEGIRCTLSADDPQDAMERWIQTVTTVMFDGLVAR